MVWDNVASMHQDHPVAQPLHLSEEEGLRQAILSD